MRQVDATLRKKIRRLEVSTRKLVQQLFAGQYHSIFKGQGMDFADFREYQPGDDTRQIDWKVTARTGHPQIRQNQESRELNLMLLVDISGSQNFGGKNRRKIDLVAEVVACFTFAAMHNNDRVGLILFTDKVELYIPPGKGRKHGLKLLQDLLTWEPESKKTNLEVPLEYLNRIQRKRSLVILVTDLWAQLPANILKQVNARHDFSTILITDPLEWSFPPAGAVRIEDAETGEQLVLRTSKGNFQQELDQLHSEYLESQTQELDRSRIYSSIFSTQEDVVRQLQLFFLRKQQKRRLA